jgi:hypothetical protein
MKLKQVDLMDNLVLGGGVASQLTLKRPTLSLTYDPGLRGVWVERELERGRQQRFLLPLERCVALYPIDEGKSAGSTTT